MTQIRNMFQELGIICGDIKVKRPPNKNDRYTVSIVFKNTQENIIKYFETIGWSYDNWKLTESIPVYEYLKFLENEKNNFKMHALTRLEAMHDHFANLPEDRMGLFQRKTRFRYVRYSDISGFTLLG